MRARVVFSLLLDTEFLGSNKALLFKCSEIFEWRNKKIVGVISVLQVLYRWCQSGPQRWGLVNGHLPTQQDTCPIPLSPRWLTFYPFQLCKTSLNSSRLKLPQVLGKRCFEQNIFTLTTVITLNDDIQGLTNYASVGDFGCQAFYVTTDYLELWF